MEMWRSRFASPDISAPFLRHLLCQAFSDLSCVTIHLYLCMFVCVCSDMLMNARQEVQLVWMSVFVCVRVLAELLYFPHANFCSPRFICFPEIPPDGNQLPSWLTGKQLQQTLHYSPLAPASPLLSPLLIFSLSHTHTLSLPFSPEAPAVDKQF